MSQRSKDISATGQNLIKKAEAIKNSALLLAEKTSDWQVIKQYLTNRLGNLELSELQQRKLTRYQFVYNQLSSGNILEKEVIPLLVKHYNISDRQAYEDLNDAKEIYSSLFNLNKMFELRLQLDINRLMLQKAKDINDIKGFAALEKNRAKLLEMIPDVEDNIAEDFKPHTFIIKFDPSLIGAPDVDMKQVLEYINHRRKRGVKTDNISEAEVIK